MSLEREFPQIRLIWANKRPGKGIDRPETNTKK